MTRHRINFDSVSIEDDDVATQFSILWEGESEWFVIPYSEGIDEVLWDDVLELHDAQTHCTIKGTVTEVRHFPFYGAMSNRAVLLGSVIEVKLKDIEKVMEC